MRILFLTNIYPPARLGGYSQWCSEVAGALKERGHIVSVLTSNLNVDKILQPEEDVSRFLHLENDLDYYQPAYFFRTYRRHQFENSEAIKQTVRTFSPDIIFIWGMWAMSKVVPALAERLCPSRVIYYLSDYWTAAQDMHTSYWKGPARNWYMRLPKRLLSKFAFMMIKDDTNTTLGLDHVICVSQAVKNKLIDSGLPLQNARVIYGGTDLNGFRNYEKRDYLTRPIKFLYAGQLVQHKGVHTTIEAISKLINFHGFKHVTLTIIGWGHPDYEKYLHTLVLKDNIGDNVIFLNAIKREEMPRLMERYHVLIFPSIYEEPFARLTQEAMLSGMVVVGTTTGGTKEILEEGINGLTFMPEDQDGLADQMVRLTENPELCQQLSENGRNTVLNHFTLDGMVEEIEEYLEEVLSQTMSDETTWNDDHHRTVVDN